MQKVVNLIKEACENLKEHPEIITIWSGFSVILVALFRAGAYIYYRGWFEQMNIPICYIEVDYQNVLYQFVVVTIVLFFVFLFSYKYQEHCLRLKQKRKKGARFLLHVVVILFVIVCTFGYFVICLLKDYTWSQIWKYISLEPLHILSYVVNITVICWGIMRVCGFSIYPTWNCKDRNKENDEYTKEREQSTAAIVNEKDKIEFVSKEKLKRKWLIYIVAIVISLFILSCTVYKSGKDRIRLINKASIVSMDGNTYYIAEESMERAIVKECVLDGENLVINESHYRLTMLVDKNVIVKEIDGGLDGCIMNGKEYERLYGK